MSDLTTTDLGAMNTFLAEPRNALIAAIRSDGRPMMTPNWFLWDGSQFFVSTTKSRAKFRLFSRDPRVQLAIDDSMGFRYVVVDGNVDIRSDIETGLPYFRDLRLKHGNAMADDELRAEMVRDERVLLVITPDKPQSEWHAKGF
jgi:PPOX class probable F420-dependent enzyme